MKQENTSYFVVGPTEPKENVGPWLKDGLEWWLYDDEKKKYYTLQKIYNGGAS